MKIDLEKKMDERAQNLQEDFAKKKEIIIKVGEQKENASIEMAKVVDQNKAIRDEVHREL